MDETGKLLIKRINGREIKIDVVEKVRPDFKYDKDNGKIIVEYPNGEKQEVDGFYVHERDYIFAIDDTLNGVGSIYDPLRLSSLEKTGTYAPVDEFIDLTIKGKSLPEDKNHGYRVLTKEYIKEESYLYSLDGISNIQKALKENNSQWRIPTKED
jgi:hypothetical protein